MHSFFNDFFLCKSLLFPFMYTLIKTTLNGQLDIIKIELITISICVIIRLVFEKDCEEKSNNETLRELMDGENK